MMSQSIILTKDSIEVFHYFNFDNKFIDYFQKDYYNDKKKEEKEKVDLYKIDRQKKTEDDLNNNEDDWEDDKNDSFEYKDHFSSHKEKKEDTIEKFDKPVDIRKIGNVGSIKKQKCDIAYLGNGFSDDVVLCDNLICTKCDCKVSIFKNNMWDIDVDYLFFRNNFATPEKLKQKLVESYGTYAYSCQCSWQNISDEYVPAMKVSNWVCGGHKI